MTIYNALQIGDHHTNHCEDYLIIAEIGKSKFVCAVLDGCSMGTESYFASTLSGKLLRKISKEVSYQEFISKESIGLQQILEIILRRLFHELHTLKNLMQLEKDEILNTLLIAVIDTEDNSGEFLCVGDGLICINNRFIEFEQNDRPDYLGYHLHEDFNEWFEKLEQRISAKRIKDFSIATDGIFTLKKFDTKIYQEPGNVIEFLLVDAAGYQTPNMLTGKLYDIQKDWGLRPTDDLAIIRGILS